MQLTNIFFCQFVIVIINLFYSQIHLKFVAYPKCFRLHKKYGLEDLFFLDYHGAFPSFSSCIFLKTCPIFLYFILFIFNKDLILNFPNEQFHKIYVYQHDLCISTFSTKKLSRIFIG